MKKEFIQNILTKDDGFQVVDLLGWIKSIRKMKTAQFIDLCDSTGTIQIVIPEELLKESSLIQRESAIAVSGMIKISDGKKEIHANQITIISPSITDIAPKPRTADIFSPDMTDHLLNNRHIYARNPQFMAVMKFRSKLMYILGSWFRNEGFTEVHTPILTNSPLYEDRTVIGLRYMENDICLTQCAGFYLESMVQGLEKIYNIGPSFRGETSKSRRHLAEYWHVKAELAWINREDLFALVEKMLYNIITSCNQEAQEEAEVLNASYPETALNIPYPRITYQEAIEKLDEVGIECQFGKGLSTDAEDFLAKGYETPFWLVGIPRSIEPFPYVIDPNDSKVTMTADLILPDSYGELLGIAEKIHQSDMLQERMIEKGKDKDHRYDWCKELREIGCAPHGGFGMGFERLIRWLLQLNHVREAAAFPRMFHRNIYP